VTGETAKPDARAFEDWHQPSPDVACRACDEHDCGTAGDAGFCGVAAPSLIRVVRVSRHAISAGATLEACRPKLNRSEFQP
jgi:hypothetical protein